MQVVERLKLSGVYCGIAGICAIGLLGGCGAPGAAAPGSENVDEMLDRWDRADHPGGFAAVVQDGEVVYERFFGMADIERDIRWSPEIRFNLTRQSLPFTAAVAVHARRAGALSFEHDVRMYVPELPDYGHRITVGDLVYHTSGIRDYQQMLRMLRPWSVDEAFGSEDALGLLARVETLEFAPGEKASFSQSNYFLLGVVIERATGQSLADYAAEHVFGPLGMSNTYFYSPDLHAPADARATAYRMNGDRLEHYEYADFSIVGDMGLWTTIGDLYLWESRFYDDALGPGFSAEVLERGTLRDGSRTDYAAGIQWGEYKGLRTLNHVGWFMGFQMSIVRFPDHGTSIIFASNLRTGGPINRVEIPALLADRFLEQAIRQRYAEYEGDYVNAELPGTYRIGLKGTDLYLLRDNAEEARLVHDRDFWRPTRIVRWPPAFETYEVLEPGMSRFFVTFTRSEDGTVDGLLAERRPRTLNIRFDKRGDDPVAADASDRAGTRPDP